VTEFFPILSEVKNLRAVRPGQEIEVRFNGAPYCRGKIEQMDADLGVIWVRDTFNERRLLNASDFSFWRYVL
jgi:hypothetical protein